MWDGILLLRQWACRSLSLNTLGPACRVARQGSRNKNKGETWFFLPLILGALLRTYCTVVDRLAALSINDHVQYVQHACGSGAEEREEPKGRAGMEYVCSVHGAGSAWAVQHLGRATGRVIWQAAG